MLAQVFDRERAALFEFTVGTVLPRVELVEFAFEDFFDFVVEFECVDLFVDLSEQALRLRLVLGDLEFVEQDLAQLLGLADVETGAGPAIDLLLRFFDALRKHPGIIAQGLLVDTDPLIFHRSQDGHQWCFHLLKEPGELLFV